MADDDDEKPGSGSNAEAEDAPKPRARDADRDTSTPAPAARKPRPRRSAARDEAEAAPQKPTPARPRRRKPAEDTASAKEAPAEPDVVEVGDAPAVTLAAERSARRALGAGGVLAALGVALVGTGPSEAGTVVVVGGLLVLIYGIHTFGRLGPQPAK